MIASQEEIEGGAPRKDLNFRKEKKRILVKEADYKKLESIIEQDGKFLKQSRIIDYSLLLGIHDKFKKIGKSEKIAKNGIFWWISLSLLSPFLAGFWSSTALDARPKHHLGVRLKSFTQSK